MSNERKMVEFGFIKIKTFCASKDITDKVKRQPTEQGKNMQII